MVVELIYRSILVSLGVLGGSIIVCQFLLAQEVE
jgi:hypothetical protein